MRSLSRSMFLLLAAVLVLAATGCGRRNGRNGNGQNGDTNGGVPVSVSPAIRQDIAKSVEVTGSLVALNDVVVGPRAAGKIVSVNVREGDIVTQGQIVAAMDPVDFDAQVQSAKANLESALTREAQANATATQAANSLRQAETNLQITDRSTGAALQSARAAMQSAQEALAVIKQGARTQEREQARQQVRATKANLDKAAADLKRMRELYAQQAISQSQLDQTQAVYDSADASYRSALETVSLLEEGARKEDIRRAELAVEQAREGQRQAEANRDLVQLRQQDVQNAREALRSARAGVEAARAATKAARATLVMAENARVNAYVRSPISGYVAARTAEPGQQVAAGGPILRLVEPGSVYFQAILSEKQYAEVAPGQSVDVSVDALPGEKFAGRVARILPVASAAARSFTVRVDFPIDRRLRPQMFARGRILVGVHRGATLVNKDAVLFDLSGTAGTLFVVSGDKAHARKVRTGYMDPHYAEILSGVRVGEKVVVEGQNTLRDGDPVTVKTGQ